MAIFQQSVLRKYLSGLAEQESIINELYQKYLNHYGSSEHIEEVKKASEDNYSEGFLTDFFEELLGYTKFPKAKYNLKHQVKNEVGQRRADAGIFKDNQVIAVFELKDTKTKITDKCFIQQAFDYLTFHSNCKYVITSNFKHLRFFFDKQTEFIEFDLFKLSKEDFKKLYLILSKDSIFNDIPMKMKQESIASEEDISKKFYRDYSKARLDIFNDLTERNLQFDNLTLFQKTQKLLDRLLFMLFAEDKGLFDPNVMNSIIEEYKLLKHLNKEEPFYDILKRHFKYIDEGYKSPYVNGFDRKEFPPYNGELFKPDEVLDNIVILDAILIENIKTITKYDFSTEVDINILGHIFEHSLNDIEEMKANLEGKEFDKKKTKRKKEGVFYTPEFITSFIIESTLGVVCRDKKKELNLEGDNTNENDIKDYLEFLKNLKILDPACGSGAFLNKALEFLKEEYNFINEKIGLLSGRQIEIFKMVDETILENNLYGVDINEESVEIAKLSLWLHTAFKGRKLCDLSKHIKCGNSLIDNIEESEKAFNWNEEFKDIIERDGFDIIIGNPPYVRQEAIKEYKPIFEKHYEVFDGVSDIYTYFYERAYNLLKDNGLLCFITSNKWMRARYGEKLRRFLKEKTEIKQIIDLGGYKVFESATVDASIVCFRKAITASNKVKVLNLKNDFAKYNDLNIYSNDFAYSMEQSKLETRCFTFGNNAILALKEKIESIGKPLKDWDVKIYRGVLTGFNEAFIINTGTKERICREDPKSKEIIKPILRGRDIHRYYYDWKGLWLISTFPSLKINIDDYPAIKKHLLSFGKARLEQTGKTGSRKKTCNEWYEIQDTIAYYSEFEKEKIIYPNMTKFLPFLYDDMKYFTNQKCFIMSAEKSNPNLLRYILVVLNSKVSSWLIRLIFPELLGGTRELNENIFRDFLIPSIDFSNPQYLSLISYSYQMDSMHKIKHLLERFIGKRGSLPVESGTDDMISVMEMLAKERNPLPPDKTIQNEIARKIINGLELKISETDREIDNLVYKLYDLTEEEIKIVEESI